MKTEQIGRRVLGIFTWGKVGRSTAPAGKIGKVQCDAFGQAHDLQHWQPYGFASVPQPGADAVIAAMGSDPSSRIAILIADRRYTLDMAGGEVAVCDDLGQRVHLTRDGIVIDAPLIKLGAGATAGVLFEGATVSGTIAGGGTFTGTITAGGSTKVLAE